MSEEIERSDFFFVGAYWNIFPQEVKFVVEMRFENYSILVFFVVVSSDILISFLGI